MRLPMIRIAEDQKVTLKVILSEYETDDRCSKRGGVVRLFFDNVNGNLNGSQALLEY